MICYSQNPSNAPQLLKVFWCFLIIQRHPICQAWSMNSNWISSKPRASMSQCKGPEQPSSVWPCASQEFWSPTRCKHVQTTPNIIKLLHVPLTADPWFLFQGAWSGLRVVHDETGTSDFFLQDRLWQFYQRLEADVACTRKLILFTLHSVCVCVFNMFQPVLTVHLFTFPEAKAT